MNRTEDFPKLWIGSFIKICLVNFLIFVNFHALLPTFPFLSPLWVEMPWP